MLIEHPLHIDIFYFEFIKFLFENTVAKQPERKEFQGTVGEVESKIVDRQRLDLLWIVSFSRPFFLI